MEEAASSRAEQLRMRLEPGVARQLPPAPAAAAAPAAGPPVRHPAGQGSGAPRSPPTAEGVGEKGVQRSGRGSGSFMHFPLSEMSRDVPLPGLCCAARVFLGLTNLSFGTTSCA